MIPSLEPVHAGSRLKTYISRYTSQDWRAAAASRSPSSASSSRSATSRSTAWASRAAQASRDAYRAPSEGRGSRYVSREAWAARLAEAVDRLVAERLLLAEDGDRLAAAARQSWDVYREM